MAVSRWRPLGLSRLAGRILFGRSHNVCRRDTGMMSNPRELAVLSVGPGACLRSVAKPRISGHGNDARLLYYVFTFQTDQRPFSWRWEIRRHSRPMGVKLGAGGYQSRTAAEFAGKDALERFLAELSKEERRRR